MQRPTYCDYCAGQPLDNLHRIYHDTQYGFPIDDDRELFERLVLEMNQAGLSWGTILAKQKNFQKAFHHFNLKKVAAYHENDRQRLLEDAGIIRNRLKIDAAIHNAQVIIDLQKSHGSFKEWIHAHHPREKADWVKLFKQTFKFTGGEITGEFLMSIGYLPGAHTTDCPVYKKILKTKPAWLKINKNHFKNK
jgi:DNA-3-methyladenine glycosylase I